MRLKLSLMLAHACSSEHLCPCWPNCNNVRRRRSRLHPEDAARITRRTFVIDGRVNGKVSVVTDRPLSRSEYFEIFLSTLRANGLVAVPNPGGGLAFVRRWRRDAQPTRISGRCAAQNRTSPKIISCAVSTRWRLSKTCAAGQARRAQRPEAAMRTASVWISPTISAASVRSRRASTAIHRPARSLR